MDTTKHYIDYELIFPDILQCECFVENFKRQAQRYCDDEHTGELYEALLNSTDGEAVIVRANADSDQRDILHCILSAAVWLDEIIRIKTWTI